MLSFRARTCLLSLLLCLFTGVGVGCGPVTASTAVGKAEEAIKMAEQAKAHEHGEDKETQCGDGSFLVHTESSCSKDSHTHTVQGPVANRDDLAEP